MDWTKKMNLPATVMFDVGIASFPYLADHGFQDLVVLPGSFFIDLALRIHIESLQASVGSIQRVEFKQPVILTERNVNLSVGVSWLNDRTVQYIFEETSKPAALPYAVLEINLGGHRNANTNGPMVAVETFQKQAHFVGDQKSFYQRLRENGNQYGPQFQNLRHIWRSGEAALGRLHFNRQAAGNERHHLDPVLLDGVIQLLSVFYLDQGRTFVLKGIGDITLFRPDFPNEVWVHARLHTEDELKMGGGVVELEVFDDTGACYLRLHDVQFAYLDHQETQEISGKTKIAIASTFTAEPIEDSLKFWGDFLEFPVQVNFAPYNQVFQELLSPTSQLRQNQDGINVILLNVGDWVEDGRSPNLKVDLERAAASFGDLARHTLPNGLEVAHLNRHETEYVFKEIFEDQCYLRHGIYLAADATVIDIGANIGLFSLFVRSRCPQASVYAYEPSPIAFRALRANCEAYGPHLNPFNVGVSEKRGSATLTFYDKSSVFSSFHPSVDEDRQAIQAVVANMVRGELKDPGESADAYVAELMTDRLAQQTFQCPLLSVSDIIRDNHLQRVSLLKVDAEKCELEILRGIEEPHWALIEQVVIEVHDRSRQAVTEVQDTLVQRGFQCAVEEENLLTGSGLFNVYATRSKTSGQDNGKQKPAEPAAPDVQKKVDQFVQALDSFTRSVSMPTVLCLCPAGQNNSRAATVQQELAEIERRLIHQTQGLPNVEVIGSEAILARYQSAEFYDPHANELGHVPYTAEGFAAIGSSLFRKLIGLRKLPHKVIVLDCDNTLWQGVCGEEGPLGVTVTPGHRALQEFMIGQMNAGMILCLCSKNSEEDVWAVFAQNPGMILKREHIAADRINWAPKSGNIRALASELNLGLESFIFLDDNPVECAEVRAQCPEILTLQSPVDSNRLTQFLDHAWSFDHARVTEEDRTRTQKVLENIQRDHYRGQVATLKDFISGLQLQVEIFVPPREQLSRISQLTQRTNQFNFTTIRRSESDVMRFLETENGLCLAAKVSDRFGDYGMVGLLFYHDGSESFDVDTFLLSCRVLGRGVEHELLSKFGRLALERGKKTVNFRFLPTKKNQPAWEFIQSVSTELMLTAGDGVNFPFLAARLAELRYKPDALPADSKSVGENSPLIPKSSPNSTAAVSSSGMSDKFQRIADDLAGAKEICAAIEAQQLRADNGLRNSVATELPATLEGKILGIWRKAMGNPQIGLDDNFADVGGTSLKAVQIVAAIRRELHLQLLIVNIFECPTVRLLCEKLEPDKTTDKSASEAMERGARRKQRARKRV